MRNIVIASAVSVGFPEDGDGRDIERVLPDPVTGLVYAASRTKLFAFDLKEKAVLWSVDLEVSDANCRLLSLDSLLDTGELCLIYENGEMLTVNSELQTCSPSQSIGGSCSAVAWSPDQNVLVLVDEMAIRFANRDFEIFNEFLVLNDTKGVDELAAVSAGWGSADTQFQGSAGKAAREKKLEKSNRAYEDDSKRGHIHWKPDGELAIVSYFSKERQERRIGLFDRDGQLRCRIAHSQPLEESVAIRPIGNYIATTTMAEDGTREFVFFERNGELRHKFPFEKLTTESRKIVNLSWDAGAKSVAIHLRSDKQGDQLQVWTVSNYKWDLKWAYQTNATVNEPGTGSFSFSWHSEKADCLYVFNSSGIVQLQFAHRYATVETEVAVIRTNRISITDFSKSIIPPPLSNYDLALESPPGLLAFNGQKLALVTAQGQINLWEKSSSGKLEKSLQIEALKSYLSTSSTLISHICWAIEHILFAVIHVNSEQKIIEVNLKENTVNEICPVAHSIMWLGSVRRHPIFLTGEGEFLSVEGPDIHKMHKIDRAETYEVRMTPEECSAILVTLSSSNVLTVNEKIISDTATSFIVHDDLICYTTFQNRLHIVDKWTGKKMLEPRNLESGAVLVGSSGSQLILQMPRGNLETIHPRILVIRPLRQLLESKKFEVAMRLMKKHRIDMNLLCDYQPNTFLTDIPLLIEQCTDTELLNLFISSMKPQCSEWCEGPVIADKINVICQSIAAEVEKLETPRLHKLFTCLLTALLKQTPSLLNDALKVVKRECDAMSEPERTSSCRAWLHYISFFVTEAALYNAALSTYDLKLAVQVAEVSNRDPKEYLPILNEIQGISNDSYRRYKIDLLREDYNSALEQISKVDEKFEEAVQLIQMKKLYAKALICYKSTEYYLKICCLVASAFEKEGNFIEATILYEKAEEIEKAISCAVLTGDFVFLGWLLKRHEDSVDETTKDKHLNTIRAKLKTAGKYKQLVKGEAVLKEIKDTTVPPTSSDYVMEHVKASAWREICVQFRPLSEDETKKLPPALILRSGLSQQTQTLLNEIDRRKAEIKRFATRVDVVRSIKEQRLKNLVEGIEDERDFVNSDAFSDAASTMSNVSKGTGKSRLSRASTSATARRRKQIDKKKQSLKEGGEYEDSALLLALKGHYEWINEELEEISQLLTGLARFDDYELAAKLQSEFDSLSRDATSRTHHLWPNRWHPRHLPGPVQALYKDEEGLFEFPEGGGMPKTIVIEPEMVAPVIKTDVKWKLQMLI